MTSADEDKLQTADYKMIRFLSGLGGLTRQPYVQMIIEDADYMIQIEPATARELALNLLRCAEAAEQDGFLVNFFSHVVGVDEGAIVALLTQYRDYREGEQHEQE